MATAAQIAANRANARKSTGPRTVEGKQRSSLNPLKHGLTASTLVLPHEDEIGYQETRGSLYQQYQPATPQECMLVDQLASAWWRTIRARQCETDMLHMQIETLKHKYPEKPATPLSDRHALACRFVTQPEQDFSKFLRYDAAIERAFYRALNTLEKLQATRLRREERVENKSTDQPIGFVSHPPVAAHAAHASLPANQPVAQASCLRTAAAQVTPDPRIGFASHDLVTHHPDPANRNRKP
jgi:hypothetical protein